MAQDTGDDEKGFEGMVIRMSSISPSVGAQWALGGGNSLRLLGFFSTDFVSSPANEHLVVDMSYLRDTGWLDSEATTAYWGANLHLHFQNLSIIAPGGVIGFSHLLNDRFSVFGEAGLNLFLDEEFNTGILGMHNSAIGIRVRL